ncbi:hypothetical protein, partial [Prevotella histicola]
NNTAKISKISKKSLSFVNKERKCCGFVATKTAAGMAAACGRDNSMSPFPCLFFEIKMLWRSV